MQQRGRKSVEAATSVTRLPDRRPEPPADFTEFEARLWRQIVASRSADYFLGDSLEQLRRYCRLESQAHDLEAMRDQLAKDSPNDVRARIEVSKEYRAVSNAANALLRSMRLTHQATWQPKTAGTHREKATVAPWDAK